MQQGARAHMCAHIYSYASCVITSVQVWHNYMITLEISAINTPHHCKVSANYTPLRTFVTAADLDPDP